MSLKPWREIAKPHKDVLEGTFRQFEFAADFLKVNHKINPSIFSWEIVQC